MSIKRVTTRAIDDSQVTTEKLADDAVTAAKIASDIAGAGLGQSVSGALDVNVDNSTIEINTDTLRVKDSGITTDKINNGAITTAKLDTTASSEAVTTATIRDGNITTAKIADSSVTTTKIADSNVTTAKIADSNITTAKIADASITPAKLSGAQSGSAPIYGARAWVHFNGTGTVAIVASSNVSSVADNSTGTYTVNFTTAMPDANYAVSGSGRAAATTGTTSFAAINIVSDVAPTTSAVRIRHVDQNTIADGSRISVVIHS